jgi:hypothetical protein
VVGLPDGVFVVRADYPVPHLLWHGGLWPWSPAGYGSPIARLRGGSVTVLTPRSTVGALRAGYPVTVHGSANPGSGTGEETVGGSRRAPGNPGPPSC